MGRTAEIGNMAMKESIIRTKSYAFAVRIVRLFQWLSDTKKEYVLSKQLLRCGTSIGANVEEAGGAVSEKEFAAKIQIAFKEALETRFWLQLLHDTDYLDSAAFDSLYADCDELVRILSSITKSLREKYPSAHESFDPDAYGTPSPPPHSSFLIPHS